MSVRKREWTTSSAECRQAWIVDYFDQSGTRRLKTFKRKKDADAWSDQTSVAIKKGEHVPDRATVTVERGRREVDQELQGGRRWSAQRSPNIANTLIFTLCHSLAG